MGRPLLFMTNMLDNVSSISFVYPAFNVASPLSTDPINTVLKRTSGPDTTAILLTMFISPAFAVLYSMNSGEGVTPTIEPENSTEALSSFLRCGMQSLVRLYEPTVFSKYDFTILSELDSHNGVL